MRIIAFCGPKSSGKDTAAKYLLARNSLMRSNLFVQINFADPLKAACGIMFGLSDAEMNDPILKEKPLDRWPYVTPREILQKVAKLFRTMYAPDFWVRGWERKMLHVKTGCIVVTDLRHVEELDKLKEYGAKIVYIHNPKVEKARAEGIASGDPLWSDQSEAFAEVLRLNADVVIPNDGAHMDTLHAHVDTQAKKLIGDWQLWPEAAQTNPKVSL